MYSFTPQESGAYTFYAENYSGGNEEYDTYLKLYGDKNMSRLIGNHANRIILWLDKGKTYYLQFSGYFMVHAKANNRHSGEKGWLTGRNGGYRRIWNGD